MKEVLLETSIPAAHDPNRVYYIDQDGISWDLKPGLSQQPPKYEIITDKIPNDPRRVFLRSRDGLLMDVSPAIAAIRTRPVVFVGPQAIATLTNLLCGK